MYRGRVKAADSANIVRDSTVIGDVTVGENSTVLFYSVLRGDVEEIIVGKCSNIQDNCTIHADEGFPAVIGDYVTVGHNAVVHGCTIGEGSLIGMGAVVMKGARIGKECLIGAGSVVLEHTVIPDGSLAVGNPAKVKRLLTEEEREKLYAASREYVQVGKRLREEGYCRANHSA